MQLDADTTNLNAFAVRVLLISEFERPGLTYDSRRLQRQLDHQGIRVGLHRVLGLMEELQILTIWKRKYYEYNR